MKITWTTALVTTVLGFASGYFYGGTVPRVIEFRKTLQISQIRDADWHRCSSTSAVINKTKTEELWSCPKTKFFIVRENKTIGLDFKEGAQ